MQKVSMHMHMYNGTQLQILDTLNIIIDTSPDLIKQVYMSTFQGCSSFVYLLRLCSWDHAIHD